jgi:hypothetical protein
MSVIGMFEFWSVDYGIIRSKKGERDCNEDSKTYRGTHCGREGLLDQLEDDKLSCFRQSCQILTSALNGSLIKPSN